MEQVRALFPGTAGQIYLDIAVRNLLPEPTRAAIRAWVDARVMGTGARHDEHNEVERARRAFATLIGGRPDEVAIVKNVSEGLNLFAASLPWRAGDNVILCPDLEHPNNVFLWYSLRALRGIEVRTIPADQGRLPVERFAAAIDGRTRVVTMPHISFAPGFISDVAAVGSAARSHAALVLLDAAQSVGAIRTDVTALGVDAIVAATQKSLLALYGFGFLWIRRDLADTLHPAAVARYGIDLAEDASETAVGEGPLRFRAGARRFDLGNYNYLGACAAAASLDLIASIGVDRIEAHVRRLAARLADGLIDLGVTVAGGPSGPHLAHIVAVGAGGGRHDSTDDPALNRLHEHLSRNRVRLSLRRGMLRMSIGLFNTADEIDEVLALVRAWTVAGGVAVPS